MKKVYQNPKSGKLSVEEITRPVLKSGGLLVKNHFSVISAGTERSIIELSKKSLVQKAKERPDYVQKFFMLLKTKGIFAAWRVAQSKLDTDIALGYSSAGEVVGIGDGVEGFRVGDMVACAGQDYASHAEEIFVPKNLCAKIPKGIALEDAAFTTLGAIALQGIRRAELTGGEKVAVVGLGLLGQIAARILKAYGYPVIGFDVSAEQIKFACDNGLDEGVVLDEADFSAKLSKFTDGKGADAVLIYASSKTDGPMKLAVDLARDRGRVVQVGNVLANIPWRDFYKKELSFFSSRSYGPGRYDKNYEEKGGDYPFSYVRWTEKRNMEEFLRLLSEKRVSVENLKSGTFKIEEAEKAYELVFNSKKLVHGIVLAYDGEKELSDVVPFEKPETKSKSWENIPANVGLIGVGSFMKSTIIPHIKKIKDMRVVAVCDSNGLQSKKLGKSLGADYTTSDYGEILKDEKINLVICATRHSSHAKIAKEALIAGKNIYIEKPLALTKEDLIDVLETAKKSKGELFVGFNRRFSRHLEEARNEFSDSSTPLFVVYRINAGPIDETHWSHDEEEGGRFIGEGCHFTDALQFIVGSRPRRVYASAIPASGAVRHEDTFSITIEYENGSVGVILYSSLGNFRVPKEYVEIYGGGRIMIIDNFKDAKVMELKKTRHFDLWHQDKGYGGELRELVDMIKNGKTSPISLEDLYFSHITIFKAAESLKSGKAIEL